jgi:hypothetical protein
MMHLQTILQAIQSFIVIKGVPNDWSLINRTTEKIARVRAKMFNTTYDPEWKVTFNLSVDERQL